MTSDEPQPERRSPAPGGDARATDSAPGGDARATDSAPGGDARTTDAAPGDSSRVDDAGSFPGRNGAPDTPPEPLTMSTMGRLFAVPLIIISIIVGGAVVVVLAFGSLTAERSRSIGELLTTLEQSSGEPLLGLLAPREKELWQTAMELGARLEKKDAELSPEELDEVVRRLSALVARDLEAAAALNAETAQPGDPVHYRAGRLQWLIRALGRSESPDSIPALVRIVESGVEPYRMTAIAQLAAMGDVPGVRAAIPAVTAVLGATDRPETLVVACAALSVLADPGDEGVIEALSAARLAHEGEVGWNASLALARLGSPAGKLTLLDLLDRPFWEAPDRYQHVDRSGATHRYAMPRERIEQFMVAAIDAVHVGGLLDDPELRDSIEVLTSDSSLEVRRKATDALESGE